MPRGTPPSPPQHLEHPNVLGLLGVYVSNDGTLGIVTEFLPRGSVFDVIHSYGERSFVRARVTVYPYAGLAGCVRTANH